MFDAFLRHGTEGLAWWTSVKGVTSSAALPARALAVWLLLVAAFGLSMCLTIRSVSLWPYYAPPGFLSRDAGAFAATAFFVFALVASVELWRLRRSGFWLTLAAFGLIFVGGLAQLLGDRALGVGSWVFVLVHGWLAYLVFRLLPGQRGPSSGRWRSAVR